MGVNELMATLLPAAAAAGAATLVGWQGVEQMRGRFQAINATAESLGPAYGITTGSYLGIGSALQRYQDLATGGVYELGGAGINLARMGAGTFGQIGLDTIAMLDRGVADMQINMAQRGTMGLLGGLAGKGTGYLRQFGDIGANLGNIFLGLAPHLPGVGEDYLSLLEGITGALGGGIGFLNQHGLGDVLGAGLAGEAGWRVGKPVVGLLGRLLSRAGGGLFRLGMGTGLGDAGLGMAGFGDALGMLGGPEVAALAMSAFLGGKLISSMPSPAQRQMAALQAQVSQAGFAGAWQPLARAITVARGLAAQRPSGMAAAVSAGEAPFEAARFGPVFGPTTQQVYQNAAQGFTQQMASLVNAGPQLVDALHKAGLKSVSMGDAFQIAQNALLDLTHAFDSHGRLNKQATQMLDNYVKAIGPMTQSAGGFNAAVAAQTIMSSPAMQNLSKVNQAMDSMTQIMQAGPAGMATLATMRAGAPPAAMAKALTSFTSPAGSAAWTAFASTSQPSIISAMQAFNDQMRTGLTLSALSQGQAAGLTGYELKQFLPMARQSPAALAMLMQQGAQQGITPYYDPSKTQAQNYAAAVAATGKIADNARQANQAMNSMTIHLANLPATARQFAQGFAPAIQTQELTDAAQNMVKLQHSVQGLHPKIDTGSLQNIVSDFQAAGLKSGDAIRNAIDTSLKGVVSPSALAGINAALGRIMHLSPVKMTVTTDTSKVQAQLAAMHGKNIVMTVSQTGVTTVQEAIRGINGKTVIIRASASGVGAAQAAIDAVHGKTVDIVIRTIITGGSVSNTAMQAAGYAPGVSASTIRGIAHKMGMQTGGVVPGSGFGDIVPAMLEPGEVVIPRNLVSLVAPILAAHRVPGFGGMPQSSSTHFAAGGVVPSGQTLAQVQAQIAAAWKTLDALYARKDAGQNVQAQISAFWKQVLDPLYAQKDALTGKGGAAGPHAATARTAQQVLQALLSEVKKSGIGHEFAVEIIHGLTKSVDSGAAANAVAGTAQALVGKIGQEVSYARNVAAAARMGQGFGNAGIFGSMDVTPGTGNGTVFEQLQSYVTTVQQFTKDLAALRKGHLNKDIIAQIVAAGPVQGDALAQSILNDYGGIKGVNQLWAQLGVASKGLGAQAAMGVYGGVLAPNLKSGTFTSNHVTVNVQARGGTTLSLTPAQVKQLVELIQAKLLQQARRNQKTGIQAAGKGA
jgi:hypothetical protein